MKGRWRYVVPNLLTSVSISLGLYAIGRSVAGGYVDAAWAVLWCVLLDKADGTAARLLDASSEFGAQMDSLADLITFGAAPGTMLLAALVGNKPLVTAAQAAQIPLFRPAVYVAAFFFVICSALRLAKFNVVKDAYGREYFFGVPTTMCGALICSYWLAMHKYQMSWHYFAALPAIYFVLALLMVSRVPLHKVIVRKRLIYNIFQFGHLIAVYITAALRIYPEYLFGVAVFYLVTGPSIALFTGVRAPKLRYNTPSGKPEVIRERDAGGGKGDGKGDGSSTEAETDGQ